MKKSNYKANFFININQEIIIIQYFYNTIYYIFIGDLFLLSSLILFILRKQYLLYNYFCKTSLLFYFKIDKFQNI